MLRKLLVGLLALCFAGSAYAADQVPLKRNNGIPAAFGTGDTVGVSHGGTGAASASGTALDNISGFASTGFLTRTGAGAYSFQSLTNGINLGNIAQIAANTTLGNATASTANIVAQSMPSCSAASSALTWTTSSGFGCNTITATGAAISGTPTAGNCTSWLNSTTIQDAGAACGSGGSTVVTLSPSGVLTISGSVSGGSNLRIVCLLRSALAGNTDGLSITFNSDATAAHYGTATYTGGLAGAYSTGTIGVGSTGPFVGNVVAASGTASVFSIIIIDIPNYNSTTPFKAIQSHATVPANSFAAQNFDVSSYWASTAAITSVQLTMAANYVTGSKLYLYTY